MNSKREIYFYWKQLEDYERNGPNFTYHALVTQDDKTKLYTPMKDKSMSFIDIKDAAMSAVQIHLKSVNSEGSSANSSYLYIPSDDNILEGPASFTKLAYANGTYALYWEVKNIEHIENYTLFWCEYNVSRSCVGRMNFTYLDSTKTFYITDYLPKETKYQFAISVNNGMKSSGMYWAKCDISHDIIVMYAFPVTLSHDKTGKNYVTLSWKMACSLQNNIILAYNISYCPVVNKFFCDGQVQNKSILISPEKNQVNITGLRPYKTYRFTFALNTTYGLREVENATDYVTTSPDSPEKPVNAKNGI
ncbi:Cytokine receptor [Eumeta japonica]|uniref:Cytokine receptor n=1 Tax=Eumeta variegata TaxID=151549 RepID=A0A4C1V8U8_EUMVA|nr:Cytokine receptor [Eumeta japonica]